MVIINRKYYCWNETNQNVICECPEHIDGKIFLWYKFLTLSLGSVILIVHDFEIKSDILIEIVLERKN